LYNEARRPNRVERHRTTQTGTTLHWTAPSNPANCTVSGYTIYKAGTSIGTSTTTSFTVTGPDRVDRLHLHGSCHRRSRTGVQSSSISVTTLATPVPPSPVRYRALRHRAPQQQHQLSWSAVTAPSAARSAAIPSTKAGAALATVSSGTTYTATGLSASTAYSFTVAAIDGAGTSAQSSAVNVTTTANPTGKGKVIGYWNPGEPLAPERHGQLRRRRDRLRRVKRNQRRHPGLARHH